MTKAPAFQLYAADFYMDTVGWSCEEVGLYFRLLMAEWVNGPLPNDTVRLAKTCQMSFKKFDHLFKNVLPKFVQNEEGHLINLRLEETRQAQLNYSESRRISAKARWSDKNAYAERMECVNHALHSSSSINNKNNKILVRPRGEKVEFKNSLFHNIPDALFSKWKVSCPGIDIKREIARAEAWVISNPKQKKSNWERFLTNWMVRAQDRARPEGGGNGTGIRSDARRWLRRPGEDLSPDAQQAIADAKQAGREALARRAANRAPKDT